MRIQPVSESFWAIVAATGGAERPPDRAASSPKLTAPAQYRSLPDSPVSPLQKALHRATAIAPRQRIVTVVAAKHRPWWQETLWFLPRSNVIMQPESFGSAFGLFVALLQILERDPGASVVLLPSTHQVQDEEILTPWIHRAATLAALRPQRLFVLGIEREAGITASAYIVTGRYDNRGGFEIARLFEAPPSVVPTQNPIERRVLWNSGIVAGAGTAFLQLFRRRVPDLIVHGQAIAHGAARGHEYSSDVSQLSESLSGLDFRRHVLPGQESHLRVLPVPRCGWSDLGAVDTGGAAASTKAVVAARQPQRAAEYSPQPVARLGDIPLGWSKRKQPQERDA